MEAWLALIALVLAIAAWLLKRRGDRAFESLQITRAERDEEHRTLQDLTERLEFVAASIAEGVVLLDKDERIIFVNSAAEKLLDSPKIGKSFDTLAWHLQIEPLVRGVLQQKAESLAQVV